MAYALIAAPVAQRELDHLPTRIAEGIRQVLHALAEEPRSKRFDLKKLQGNDARPPPLRLRLGDYRVILQIYHELQEIRIARIGLRSTVYRGWGNGD